MTFTFFVTLLSKTSVKTFESVNASLTELILDIKLLLCFSYFSISFFKISNFFFVSTNSLPNLKFSS